MRTVTKWEEVLENLLILELYRHSKSDDELEFYADLIRRGHCFVVFQREGEYFLGASRFVGYIANILKLHVANTTKDGKVTNPELNKIFDARPSENSAAEKVYLDLCSDLGVQPSKVNRTYWMVPA